MANNNSFLKILFLTTHNLAANPRLVKEIKLALQHNYEVEVICYTFRNWSYEINDKMLQEFQSQRVKFHCIEAGRKNIFDWFIAVSKEKLARLFSQISSLKNAALANAVSRRNVGLLAAVNKINSADWVIGHNPGALWATLTAGERLKCKMGFDVEDYHPGEGNDVQLQGLTKKLMEQVLPKMDYVSFAAPMIREAVKEDLGSEGKNWVTILNYFPSTEFITPSSIEGPLQLVWFSQNISWGRGLELAIPSIKNNKENVELHLFGNIDARFYDTILKGIENIKVHSPLPQKELHQQLSRFDIGLALELADDRNRGLCITNKILAYLQAGLFVLASNTLAQQNFLIQFQDVGIINDILKERNASVVIDQLVAKKEQIRNQKEFRFLQFKNNCWEVESKKILKTWRQSKI